MNRFLLGLLALLMISTAPVQAAALPEKDIADGADSSILFRYAGSWLIGYEHKSFDEVELPTSESKIVDDKFVPSLKIQGQITHLVYLAPLGRSVLEVQANYVEALEKNGFQKQFSCEKDTCKLGGDSVSVPYVDVSHTLKQIQSFSNHSDIAFGFMNYHSSENLRFSLYKKNDNGKDIYVTVMSHIYDNVGQGDPQLYQRTGTFIEIVEPKPLQTGMVEVINATQMKQSIDSTGHVSVYGIYFDLDKADVKPESKVALDQIAELLNKNSTLKLYVVGHTDSQGQIAHNMDLSKRRAEAIMHTLSGTYKISAERLQAVGLASYAPVSSNDSEDGRQKNRRVELVQQ